MRLSTYDNPDFSRDVNFSISDDLSIAALIKYVGSSDAADIEVDAGGDILFKSGTVGATVADTDVKTDGKIDTNTEAATLGALVDYINTLTNWRAVIVDGLRADSVDAVLLDQGPLNAKTVGGFKLFWDASTSFDVSYLVAPIEFRTDIRVYMDGNGDIDEDLPFRGTRTEVTMLSGVSTYGSNTSSFELHSESPTGSTNTADATVQMYADLTGATTVDAAALGLDGTGASGGRVISNRSEKMIARIDNDTVGASFILRGQGRMYRSLS